MSDMELLVEEAYSRDAGRGVIRIDKNTMDVLMVTTGDIVEIFGKQKAVAKCLPLYAADEGKNIIRMDGLICNNCQTEIGNRVVAKKIKASVAGSVIIMPLEAIPPIDPRYIADALESMPLLPGQFVMVPYFGGRLTFKIIETIPKITTDVQAVLVTQKTVFGILEKNLSLDSSDQSIEDERYSIMQKIWTLEKLSKPEFDDLMNNLRKFYDIVDKKIQAKK